MITELKEEQAVLYVMGLLEGEERWSFERELARDPELQARVESLSGAAAEVAWSAAATPPPGLKQAILGRIEKPRNVIPFSIPWAWAIAAGFALLASFLWLDRNRLETELTQARSVHDALAKSYAELEKENDLARLEIAQLNSSLEEYRQTTAVVVWDAAKQRGILRFTKLPPAPEDRVYQLWALDSQRVAPIPADIFDSDGSAGAVKIQVRDRVRAGVKFAISVEPPGGSASPQGPVIFVGP
jgi:anti-sigma-K factor RskA